MPPRLRIKGSVGISALDPYSLLSFLHLDHRWPLGCRLSSSKTQWTRQENCPRASGERHQGDGRAAPRSRKLDSPLKRHKVKSEVRFSFTSRLFSTHLCTDLFVKSTRRCRHSGFSSLNNELRWPPLWTLRVEVARYWSAVSGQQSLPLCIIHSFNFMFVSHTHSCKAEIT